MIRKILACFAYSLLFTFFCSAQELNNEEIWYQGSFLEESVPGFNFLDDGVHYTELRSGKIKQLNFLRPGEKEEVIFNGNDWKDKIQGSISSYSFSPDERYVLIFSDKEAIYRWSFRSKVYLYDRKAKDLLEISENKIQLAHFSPDATKLAYVYENDLYIYNIGTKKEVRVSSDGKINHIINGHADWVYEEEFSITRMYDWSENGRYLAYVQFDESEVPEFYMRYYTGDLYPDDYHFKYPKVGENNAKVKVKVFDTSNEETKEVNDIEFQHYIPRIEWIPGGNSLCITDINRHQNHIRLNKYDAGSGQTLTILEEKSPYYLDITDDLSFSSDGMSFFWTSPKSGFYHIYHYSIDGNLINQITSGDWPVTRFYGYDEKDNELFYQAAKRSPMQREIYRYDLSDNKSHEISNKEGYHTATFNSTFEFFIDGYSRLNHPTNYSIVNRKGKLLNEMEDNQSIKELQSKHKVESVDLIKVPNEKGDSLNAYIIQPSDFEEGKEYPMLMFVYGGPGSQQVLDKMPRYYWWFQMLSKKGYYVACVDNRGTGARGEEFQKSTYLQLGKQETEDQIAAASYFGNWSSVDKDRIGIFGWSYGGYVSTLCILKGSDVFNAAVAVAPVTNWKWYDSIYTERFMRTEKENEDGYKNNSPVNFAHLLEGDYLIVHGTGDDNVHPQHSFEMVNELIKHNKRFDMAFYPNKNHGIYGSFTRWHLFDHISSFIEEKL